MILSVKNYLNKKKFFWRIVNFWKNSLVFPLWKNFYITRDIYREERISESILQRSVLSLVLNLAYAAVFIGIFEYLYTIFPYTFPFQLDAPSINDLLQTTITVTGVFLGLYFTAVSAIAGNLFIQAPKNLQDLFLRERKGKQYIRTLARTTIISLGYLLLQIFKYPVSPLGPIIVVVLAAYAVIRFLSLGSRVFYFLHPSETINAVTFDISSHIRRVAVHGFCWDKDFLQNHTRIKTEQSFDLAKSFIRFAKDKMNLSSEQMVEVAKYLGGLLGYYVEKKKEIPSRSYWFRPKREFQNWILANSNELSIALNSGTPIMPKETKDRYWFEDECLNVLLEIFDGLVEQKKWEDALGCIEIILLSFEDISDHLYRDTATLFFKKVNDSIERVLSESGSVKNDEDKKGMLALTDVQGRFAISALIGLVRHVDKYIDPRFFSTKLQQINWQDKNGAYKTELPGVTLDQLEQYMNKYQIEAQIEGHFVSPYWYRSTLIAQQYLTDLRKYYEFVKSAHGEVFRKNVDELVKRKEYLLAAQLTQRWLEFSTKLSICKVRLEKLFEGYKQFHRVPDLSWVEIDFMKEKLTIESWDKEAVDRLTRLIPALISTIPSHGSDLPDYFGQAYTFGLEACYQACLENDSDRFSKIFPAVFLGALAAFDATRDKVKGWAQESQVIFPCEALAAVLHLSGFAKIYSELFENPAIWIACEAVWSDYLADPKAADKINLFVATMEYRDSQLGIIMPKAELRMNWNMKLQQKIKQMGLDIDPLSSRFDDSEVQPHHPSPLIRVLARESDLPLFDARDIFFTTYLSQHAAAKNIQFSDRRGLNEQLAREDQRNID